VNPEDDPEIFKRINTFMTSVTEKRVWSGDRKTLKITYVVEREVSGRKISRHVSRSYRDKPYYFFEMKREEMFSLCAAMLTELFIKADSEHLFG
jgi:hypothetical protein